MVDVSTLGSKVSSPRDPVVPSQVIGDAVGFDGPGTFFVTWVPREGLLEHADLPFSEVPHSGANILSFGKPWATLRHGP